MKTAELTGAALDWAVAKCEGKESHLVIDRHVLTTPILQENGAYKWFQWEPSINWAQGGPIIEREGIATSKSTSSNPAWRAGMHGKAMTWHGPTPLEAAMRCYVASKLGDEIEIPKELTP